MDVAASSDHPVTVFDADAVEHGASEVAPGHEEACHQQCVSRVGDSEWSEHQAGGDTGPGQHDGCVSEAEDLAKIDRLCRRGGFFEQQQSEAVGAVLVVGLEQLDAAGQSFFEFRMKTFHQCRQFCSGDCRRDPFENEPVSGPGDPTADE